MKRDEKQELPLGNVRRVLERGHPGQLGVARPADDHDRGLAHDPSPRRDVAQVAPDHSPSRRRLVQVEGPTVATSRRLLSTEL
jgi:hypothetical protein